MHPSRWCACGVAAALLGSIACGGTPTDSTPPGSSSPLVGQIRVDTTGGLYVRLGHTMQVSARTWSATGHEIFGRRIEWRSLDSTAVWITQGGTVGGMKRGTARIIASTGDVADTATVIVAAPWRDVAVGKFAAFSCGLTTEGRAYCWGDNAAGELGDGTTTNRLIPVKVVGDISFVRLALGGNHACGITDMGATYCWGSNVAGELGDGTTQPHSIPMLVPTPQQFRDIEAGANFTCALATTGRTFCWGDNSSMQLGITSTGSGDIRTVPTEVTGAPDLVSLGAGVVHVCGLTAQGSAYCWGWNEYDQGGNGLGTYANLPTPVLGNFTFSEIQGGYLGSCALTSEGAAYCWGGRYGGRVPNNPAATPSALPSGLSLKHLAGGGHQWCALAGAAVHCWGADFAGALNDPAAVVRPAPTAVDALYPFSQVAAGVHTCAVSTEESAYCWGPNSSGALGDGTTQARDKPTLVRGP